MFLDNMTPQHRVTHKERRGVGENYGLIDSMSHFTAFIRLLISRICQCLWFIVKTGWQYESRNTAG